MSVDSAAPLWIAEADVVSMMDMRAAIGALERGLLTEAAGEARNMVKTHVEWDGSTLHAIGAAFPKLGLCGTKTWSHTAGGATPLLILFDSHNGSLKAIIEAFALGQLRTAAASGVATKWLAPAEASTYSIIGTGKQALAQVAAVVAVRPIKLIQVFGRDERRRNEFVQRLSSQFQGEVVGCATIQEAVENAAVVTVATRAQEPVIFSEMVGPGTHINSIGAIVPTRAEVAQDVMARSTRVVTDSVPQAQKLSREMIEFFGNDPANWGKVQSLADAVAARISRSPSDDITLFKALGVGISDLSLGIELYEKAMASGLGRAFPAPQRMSPRLFDTAE